MPVVIPPTQTEFNTWSQALNALNGENAVDLDAHLYVNMIDLHNHTISIDLGIAFYIDGKSHTFRHRGISQPAKGDKFDAEIGFRLALARALEGLSNKLYKQSSGMILHADEVKQYQQSLNSDKTQQTKKVKKSKKFWK